MALVPPAEYRIDGFARCGSRTTRGMQIMRGVCSPLPGGGGGGKNKCCYHLRGRKKHVHSREASAGLLGTV